MLQDLRYALRMLLTYRGVTLVAVLVLALGIGANTAIFSVADAFLLRPVVSLPNLDRLAMVQEKSPHHSDWNTVSPANLEDWKAQSRSFESFAAATWDSLSLTGAGDPQKIDSADVGANFFSTLQAKPLFGRTFLPEEERLGQNQEAILGYGLWQRAFAGDREILGKTITLDGRSYTIIGVMSKGFNFPQPAELWVPLSLSSEARADRAGHRLLVVGRLKTGISLAQAQSEMNTISRRLENTYPKTNKGWGVRVMSIAVFAVGDLTRSYTLMLLVGVGFVLLIACANVANLQFARATARQKEIALRISLGAGRSRIVRQLLSESILLALLGALFGLLFAQWGVHLTLINMPQDVAKYIAGWTQIGLDWRAFLFALAIAVIAGVLSGLAPAFAGTHVDLNATLKEGGRSSTSGHRQHRLRNIFVVVQVMLSIVLLVGAGLTSKGVRALLAVNHDSAPRTLLTFRLGLPSSHYKTPQQITAFYDKMITGVSAIPGVHSAAIATQLPFAEGGDVRMSLFSIEGRPISAANESRIAVVQTVSPNYLPTMRIPLLRGRLLNDQDRMETILSVVVSERIVRLYWPNQDPIGHRIKVGAEDSKGPWMTVVGVVGDIKNSWINKDPEPTLYRPYAQAPRTPTAVAVRTEGDPMALLPAVRSRINSIDPDLPLDEAMSFSQMLHESVIGLQYVAVMFTVLGVIALVLAAVGVYAVMAYSVAERRHEFGVRIALGAQQQDVLRLTLGRGALLIAGGLLAGLPIAVALANLLASLLFGVNANDLSIFVLTTGVLTAAALLASYVPASRASKVDPIIALRGE